MVKREREEENFASSSASAGAVNPLPHQKNEICENVQKKRHVEPALQSNTTVETALESVASRCRDNITGALLVDPVIIALCCEPTMFRAVLRTEGFFDRLGTPLAPCR